MGILTWLVVGLIAGGIGKAIYPGHQGGGIFATIGLGIAGSILGGFIFGLGVLVSFVVGIVIVYQILYTDIRDHLPEYATMKAMGYRNRYLFQVVVQEGLLLAAMGYVPGLIVSLGLYELTLRATAGSLPMKMDLGRVGFVLVLTVLMCCVSALISVRKALSTDPAEVFS